MRNGTHITITEFAKAVGLKDPSAIQGGNAVRSKKWSKYLFQSEVGGWQYATVESLAQWRKDQDYKDILIARVGLFIEYLNKELEIAYQHISRFVAKHSTYKMSSIGVCMTELNFSYGLAEAIGMAYKLHDKKKVDMFDEYYGWKLCSE